MKLTDIFHSYQGEGRYTGMPATFVRFYGCNLKCPWCDTPQKASKAFNAEWDAIEDKFISPLIVITGGEPTLQISYTDSCIHDLKEKNPQRKFMIETNGTNSVSPDWDLVSCSPKKEANYLVDGTIHRRSLRNAPTDFKYVADNQLTVKDMYVPDRAAKNTIVFIQPEWSIFEKSILYACDIIEQYHLNWPWVDIRLGAQTHKFWGLE